MPSFPFRSLKLQVKELMSGRQWWYKAEALKLVSREEVRGRCGSGSQVRFPKHHVAITHAHTSTTVQAQANAAPAFGATLEVSSTAVRTSAADVLFSLRDLADAVAAAAAKKAVVPTGADATPASATAIVGAAGLPSDATFPGEH